MKNNCVSCCVFLLLIGMGTTRLAESAEPQVDFSGFDSIEQSLEAALIQFSSIADQLDRVRLGEINADTALQRIEMLRESLRAIRQVWHETEHDQRLEARTRRRADIERAGTQLTEAMVAYHQSSNIDFRISQMLQEPPVIGNFLREPPTETFQGIYRSGFEVSEFFLFDGEGPWWLEAATENWQRLQSYVVQRPGRGSSVTVALTITGWREADGGYGSVGGYDTRIYVESIDEIRAISEEEFQKIIQAVMQGEP